MAPRYNSRAKKGKAKKLVSKKPARGAVTKKDDDSSSGSFDWNDTGERGDPPQISIASRIATRAAASRRGKEDADMPWVRCDSCRKWRRLPDGCDLSSLSNAGSWFCRMNGWDLARASCSAPEEPYPKEKRPNNKNAARSQLREVLPPRPPREAMTPEEKEEFDNRDFVLGWVRRLRCAERAEARLPGAIVTRGKRRETGELQWIQCCNPRCGKWRSLLRSMEARVVTDKGKPWYCVMNTWDESMASCAAPQETSITMAEILGEAEPYRWEGGSGSGGGSGSYGQLPPQGRTRRPSNKSSAAMEAAGFEVEAAPRSSRRGG